LGRNTTSCGCASMPPVHRLRAATFVGVAGVTALYFFYPSPSKSASTFSDEPLSPSHFTPASVTSTESRDPNYRLITLTVPPKLVPPKSSFSTIWSVFIKDDDIQVERPYTPLEGIDEHGNMKFWIKKYPRGEVGRWLHSKQIGDKVELRGPLQTWSWKDEAWDEVIMISGGTGITPFYQLLHSTFQNAPSKTRFTLLHSSRSPSELPPPEILVPLIDHSRANPERFQMRLFVDEMEKESPLGLGRIERQAVQSCLGYKTSWWHHLFWARRQPQPPPKVLFLVCGPEPMISAIAGPYGRNYSQGPVLGILGDLGFTSNEVRKL
ncbi:ferredoxin reductase-like C-terminal NADP-linked domain-containing protein, partial [Armillaria luteobubalina]